MKIRFLIIVVAAFVAFYSCKPASESNQVLQKRIDSLQTKLADNYKPGFGEFMSNIQIHHAKLWFAGQNKNWELADFEIHEIMESLENIKKYKTERPESKNIDMMNPAIDSLNAAISGKNLAQFSKNYQLLTNTCNNCHKISKFEFNVVKIPTTPPFSNQSF